MYLEHFYLILRCVFHSLSLEVMFCVYTSLSNFPFNVNLRLTSNTFFGSFQARQKQAQGQASHFQSGANTTQRVVQTSPAMNMMGPGSITASGNIASQLARASTPLSAQQQRMQQSGSRLQQTVQQQQSHLTALSVSHVYILVGIGSLED